MNRVIRQEIGEPCAGIQDNNAVFHSTVDDHKAILAKTYDQSISMGPRLFSRGKSVSETTDAVQGNTSMWLLPTRYDYCIRRLDRVTVITEDRPTNMVS